MKTGMRARPSVRMRPHRRVPQLVRKKSLWGEIVRHKWCYIFLLPSVVMYIGFALWPYLATWYFSLFKWSGDGWPVNFVGWQNYIEILKDKYFWNAFGNTFYYAVVQTIIKLPLALLLALILNSKKLGGSSVYRAVFFLPVVTTTAIIGIVMTFIFNPYSGAVNNFLLSLGLLNRPVEWLGVETAMMVVILVSVWQMTGQYMVYWLAGLQSIPQELHEVAAVDGANGFKRLWFVTLPLLKPVAVIITLFGLVYALRVFDLVMVMTAGGPDYATDVVATYIYRYAFSGETLPRYGFSSAAAAIFSTILIIIAVGQRLLTRHVRED